MKSNELLEKKELREKLIASLSSGSIENTRVQEVIILNIKEIPIIYDEIVIGVLNCKNNNFEMTISPVYRKIFDNLIANGYITYFELDSETLLPISLIICKCKIKNKILTKVKKMKIYDMIMKFIYKFKKSDAEKAVEDFLKECN